MVTTGADGGGAVDRQAATAINTNPRKIEARPDKRRGNAEK
jgi:hypothetical protein